MTTTDTDTEDSEELDKAIVRLKNLKPAARKLKVLCTDGDTRPVPIAQTRQKWQKLRRVLDNIDWLRIEAFDSRGELLDAFETDADIDLGENDDDGKIATLMNLVISATARHVKLTNQAVKDALAEQRMAYKELLDGSAKVVTVMGTTAEATQRLYEKRLSILSAMTDDQEGQLMSSGFLEVMGEQLAKAAAPEIIKRVAGNGKKS